MNGKQSGVDRQVRSVLESLDVAWGAGVIGWEKMYNNWVRPTIVLGYCCNRGATRQHEYCNRGTTRYCCNRGTTRQGRDRTSHSVRPAYPMAYSRIPSQ